MAERNPTLEQALDLCLYGPVGMALYARDTLPGFLKAFAARGRAELSQRRDRISDQANQARTVGQFALAYGVPEVRRRAAGIWAIVEQVVVTRLTPPPQPARPDRPSHHAAARVSAPAPGTRPQLAIPDYDELSASQVVDRLEGLGTDELAAVRAYETSHRGRRTILGKIEQLTSS